MCLPLMLIPLRSGGMAHHCSEVAMDGEGPMADGCRFSKPVANQGAVATLLVHIINFITSKRAGCTSKMLKSKKIRMP